MSDPTRPTRSDPAIDKQAPRGTRAGPSRSDASYEERRLVAERYILHAHPGNVQQGVGRSVEKDTTASASPDAAFAPERLIADRYLLGARIGSGRFGPIYSADDTSVSEPAPERHVAVQLLWSELGTHKWLVDRFKTDFIRLRSWRHENIVSVLDFGRDGDTFYWVTSLLDGASLRSVAQELAPDLLPYDEASAVVSSVGRALQYAHAREKVHGDVRLETVFVTADFVVKVLDFAPLAIAHSAPLLADDLKSYGLAGTDHRDDVYGLACLAYELLSGEHPYGGSLPAEARRCGLEPERIDGLSRRAWKALARALEPAPEQRTATVRQFLSEFGIAGAERLAPAGPPTQKVVQPHSGPSVFRRVAWTAALAGLAGLVYVGYPMLPSVPEAQGWLSEAKHRIQGLWLAQESAPEELTADAAPLPEAFTAERVPAGRSPARPDPSPEALLRDTEIEAERPFEAASLSSLVGGIESNTNGASQPAPATTPERAAETAGAQPADEAQPAPALSAATASPASAEYDFEFAETRVPVSEGAAMASLVIRRTGSTIGESAFSWWTIGDTAVADEDFANFGTLVETFGDGEQSRTIHIPLVVDSLAESTERFFVGLGYDSMPEGQASVRAEVIIVDDD